MKIVRRFTSMVVRKSRGVTNLQQFHAVIGEEWCASQLLVGSAMRKNQFLHDGHPCLLPNVIVQYRFANKFAL
jgi:hypothetical protein